MTWGTAAATAGESPSPSSNCSPDTLTMTTGGDRPYSCWTSSTRSPASIACDPVGPGRWPGPTGSTRTLAGCAVGQPSVDEHHEAGRVDLDREFGCELMTGEDLCTGEPRIVVEEFGDPAANAIVAMQHTAVPDDEHSDGIHLICSSTTAPDESTSCTLSGIWPRACVEQLRHGSKQRMTASTRLSMPSVEPLRLDIVLGDLQHASVHGLVVVAGGDHQVDPLDQAVVIDAVMVHQRAAWRFGYPDAFMAVDVGSGQDVAGRGCPATGGDCSIVSMQWRISIRRA